MPLWASGGMTFIAYSVALSAAENSEDGNNLVVVNRDAAARHVNVGGMLAWAVQGEVVEDEARFGVNDLDVNDGACGVVVLDSNAAFVEAVHC